MGCSQCCMNEKNIVSFKCIYDVKYENEIQILNDIDEDIKEIKSKIKILNGNKKEELIFKKKFDKLGYNTIEFIIEEKLNNLSLMFFNCSSLIKIEFLYIDTSQVTNML